VAVREKPGYLSLSFSDKILKNLNGNKKMTKRMRVDGISLTKKRGVPACSVGRVCDSWGREFEG